MSDSELLFTLDHLFIVKAIAREGSFRRAAESLFLSQPAVSLQIQNLERQLGVTLFNRKGRQIKLTESGQVFLSYGERILKLCQESQQALLDLEGLKRGTLLLGASQTVGTYVMPGLIGQFCRKYPDVSVNLLVQSTRRITHKVLNGELDLAMVGGEIPPELHSDLEITAYAQDEFILVGEKQSGSYREVLQKEDLLQLKFITLDPQSSTRQTLDRALRAQGIDPTTFQVQIELSSIEAIKTAVKAGLGVAFISLTAVRFELEQNILQRLDVEGMYIPRTIWLTFLADRYRSRSARLFYESLLQQVKVLS